MRSFLHTVSWLMLFGGIYGILWPLPGFLMSEEMGNAYFRFIWRLPSNDKSAGAALPLFWMFITAPFGVCLIFGAFGMDFITGWLFPRK